MSGMSDRVAVFLVYGNWFGAVEAKGGAWASLLKGNPDFLQSPAPTHLRLDALSAAPDPAIGHGRFKGHLRPVLEAPGKP